MYGERIAKWEKAVEWPLTLAAVLFLAAYAIQIIARPGGLLNLSCEIVLVAMWAVFVVDYVVRLAIAQRRWRWFYQSICRRGAPRRASPNNGAFRHQSVSRTQSSSVTRNEVVSRSYSVSLRTVSLECYMAGQTRG